MKENKTRKQDAGGVGRCGGKGDPDLSFTNDFFSEIYAENGESCNWKFRFDLCTLFRILSKDWLASIS